MRCWLDVSCVSRSVWCAHHLLRHGNRGADVGLAPQRTSRQTCSTAGPTDRPAHPLACRSLFRPILSKECQQPTLAKYCKVATSRYSSISLDGQYRKESSGQCSNYQQNSSRSSCPEPPGRRALFIVFKSSP